MKKMISLILALMMICSLATVAFAADPGSITINGASADNTYSIYQLLDLESYDTTSGAYSYKVNSAWINFFKEGTGALDYMDIGADGYVTWKGAENDDRVAAFAKLALAYAKTNGMTALASKNGNTSGAALVFNNLKLGYYLIESTMGALCGLTTTNPNAAVNAKNAAPTIDKQVQEDSTSQWGENNTADIGQTVEFRTTINVHAGAENFVLHDKMSTGLTYQGVSKIEHIIPDVSTTAVPAAYYTVVTDGLTDGCTFHVVFNQAFCDHLETNDKVVVYYSAMLNRHAIVAGDGNKNEAKLDFGVNHFTEIDTTITKTYSFEIAKTDSQNMLIDGAQFKVYDAEIGGAEIAVVPLLKSDNVTPVLDEYGHPMYRRARADETGVAIEVKGGLVTVVGFDNGTYYLEEVVSPAGFNKLTTRQKFIISDSNLDAIVGAGNIVSTGSGVHVVNKSGTMLPETGAAGTAMFITIGMILVLGTGLLLVTKKRMSMIVD